MTGHSESPRTGLEKNPLWYKDAVFYEVRARSFFDSDGDGAGDLAGLTAKLDYLADLGITALWILPHYPSPGRDDGYDIADYTSVHPELGTLEDFDKLVAEAHARGIRVVTELVLNHTSDQHPWFQRARNAPAGSTERDYYVWSDDAVKYPEARIIFRDFEASNWSWDPVAKAHFWHRFFSHQPDLNFENPAVKTAMFEVVDFWFARGVDGLRLDAVPYLYEEEGTNCENLPKTHVFLKELRAHVDAKFEDRMLLAEANQWPEDAARYFGDGDECHMNFHFPIMPRLFMAIHMEDRFPIVDILQQTPTLPENCQWAMFLRNHDELTLEMVTDEERDTMYRAYAQEPRMRINLGIRRRLAPLVGNDRRKMELLNGLLFSMPGTPVIYYGDEIGMGDNVYLGDRNGVRTPMQWSPDRNAGFSRANPQKLILPIVIDPEYHYEALHVEGQQQNPNSLLWWTKRLIALRKRYVAFGRGTMEVLRPKNPRVLAYARRHGDEVLLVVANLSRHTQYVELDLAEMKGLRPVELVGRAKFPEITERPMALTLGPFGFYWFALERPPADTVRDSVAPMPRVGSASERKSGAAFVDALVGYLGARGWLAGRVSEARIVDMISLGETESAVVRVDYEQGEPDMFCIPVEDVAPEAAHPAVIIAEVAPRPKGDPLLVVEGVERFARELSRLSEVSQTVATRKGRLVTRVRGGDDRRRVHSAATATELGSGRQRSVLSFGESNIVEVSRKLENGVSPLVEIGEALERQDIRLVPHVRSVVDYVGPTGDRATLAVVRELVQCEGTAWQHARRDVARAYDRALAQGSDAPTLPRAPWLALSALTPGPEYDDVASALREWATLFGRRTAELHLALASAGGPEFSPVAYTALDIRSLYQASRNAVGRVLGLLDRLLLDLSPAVRERAEALLGREEALLRLFEPTLVTRTGGLRIRIHGNLHLGTALFTGNDFIFTSFGARASSPLKASAFRDVASVIRSYAYAARISLSSLRPEDRARAEGWGNAWATWASAAFVSGYMSRAHGAPFLPDTPALASLVLEAAVLEKALMEARSELEARSENAAIPLDAILHAL